MLFAMEPRISNSAHLVKASVNVRNLKAENVGQLILSDVHPNILGTISGPIDHFWKTIRCSTMTHGDIIETRECMAIAEVIPKHNRREDQEPRMTNACGATAMSFHLFPSRNGQGNSCLLVIAPPQWARRFVRLGRLQSSTKILKWDEWQDRIQTRRSSKTYRFS